MILQAGEDVGEPGQWIDVVELGGLDQGIDCSGPPATIVGSGEGPVATSDGDAAKGALCSVVAEAQAAIVEEAAKSLPAVEAVGDGLGDLTGRRQCACRKLYPAIMMMKAAEDRLSNELAEPLDRPIARRILIQGQVRSEFIVIAGVGIKDPA